MLFLAPIVEGHGEETAVPALLHRIAQDTGFPGQVRVNPPIRVKSGSFLNDTDYFRRYVSLAAEKAKAHAGAVVVILDCDDLKNCPAELGPTLLRRATAIRPDVPILVSLAWREFETWFLTAAASLAGKHGLPDDLTAPPDPEGIRAAKEWLGDRMPHGYDPIIHQAAFTKLMDTQQARRNRSFDRLYRKVGSMLAQRPAG